MTSESKHIRFVDSIHIEGGPDTVIKSKDLRPTTETVLDTAGCPS
jgi:hypothetical protein